jgi:integrase
MHTPYKHHLKNCPYKKDATSKTKYVSREDDGCKCIWYYDRYVDGVRRRTSLHTANFNEACRRIKELEVEGDVPKQNIPSIVEAIDKCVAEVERLLAPSTARLYKLLRTQLKDWCAKKGYRSLRQLDLSALEDFVVSWGKIEPRTEKTRIQRVKRFFNFCVERKWLTESPAKELKARKVNGKGAVAFDEEQIARILAACSNYRGTNRDKLIVLTNLMLASGLRISDSVMITRDKIVQTQVGWSVKLNTRKTDTPVSIPIKDDLALALRALGEHPFWSGHSSLEHATKNWREIFIKVFEAAGVEGTPHQLRHTAAKRWILARLPVLTISKLLGHENIQTTQDTYMRMIQEREDAIDAEVRATWDASERIPVGTP